MRVPLHMFLKTINYFCSSVKAVYNKICFIFSESHDINLLRRFHHHHHRNLTNFSFPCEKMCLWHLNQLATSSIQRLKSSTSDLFFFFFFFERQCLTIFFFWIRIFKSVNRNLEKKIMIFKFIYVCDFEMVFGNSI